jgi:hypothetical protein
VDHGTILVQPAGPVGKRHVFLTIAFSPGDDIAQQLESVFSERVDTRLGQALTSRSFGLTQEFNFSVDGCE